MSQFTAAQYVEHLAATVQAVTTGKPADNIISSHPTLDLLTSGIKSGSGLTNRFPVHLGLSNRTERTDRSATTNTAPTPQGTANAIFDWSQIVRTPARSRFLDLELNKGNETQIYDAAQHDAAQAIEDHRNFLVQDIHALGATYDPGTPGDQDAPIVPLDVLIGDATTDALINGGAGWAVGGIRTFNDGTAAPAQNAAWQSTVLTLDPDLYSHRAALRQLRRTIYNNSGSQAHVTDYLAGFDFYAGLEDELDNYVRISDNQKVETVHSDIRVDGVRVRLDPDMTGNLTTRVYGIHKPSMVIKKLNDHFMKTSEPRNIQGTEDFITYLTSVLTMYTDVRRNHGRFDYV